MLQSEHGISLIPPGAERRCERIVTAYRIMARSAQQMPPWQAKVWTPLPALNDTKHGAPYTVC